MIGWYKFNDHITIHLLDVLTNMCEVEVILPSPGKGNVSVNYMCKLVDGKAITPLGDICICDFKICKRGI